MSQSLHGTCFIFPGTCFVTCNLFINIYIYIYHIFAYIIAYIHKKLCLPYIDMFHALAEKETSSHHTMFPLSGGCFCVITEGRAGH